MSRNISEQEDGLTQLRTQREALAREGERLDADWQTLWDKAPFEPLAPAAMLEWLETRAELLRAIEHRAEATGELESIAKRSVRPKRVFWRNCCHSVLITPQRMTPCL